MNQAAIELDAMRMLLVKVAARHVADAAKADEITRNEALEALLAAGERDIGRMQWARFNEAQTHAAREHVKAAYASLIDAVALGVE
jgi:hypothetical protein